MPPDSQEKDLLPRLHDNTAVPLRWVFAVCSVIITYAIFTAKTDVAGIREEIRAMAANISSLNASVNTLLTERDYTKKDIEALKLETGKNRELIWELQKDRPYRKTSKQ